MEAGILAKALYTNTPEAKNELFFRKGDILTVLQFDYDGQIGWWLCSLRGEKGLCPGNYFELLKESQYAPIYSNEISKDDDSQPAYDVPRSHNATVTVEPTVNSDSQTPDLFYDVPRSVKSFDTRSNASHTNSQFGGGSEISLMSSGTLSHYSSSSSSAQSSEISDVRNNYANSTNNVKQGSISVRSSGICSEGDGLEDNWYDVPRPANSALDARVSISASSGVLTDSSNTNSNSISNLYDVPRSVEEIPGLTERVQLRNKSSNNVTSTLYHRRAQFGTATTKSFGTSSLRGSKLSFGSPLSTNSLDICCNNPDDETQSLYDKPPSVRGYNNGIGSRKAPSSVCSSSDTISISSAGNSEFRKAIANNHRGSSNLISNSAAAASQESLGGSGGPDVKSLPLTPKAAVSVCEKMRQEVVTGINSVLMFVKPDWRVKANLEEVMPDLRFGCVRLNLAIKDFAEFCSRSVSNARKLENEILIAKLRRLLAPINSSSQIIQQSVYELEAYFWSPDRLSMRESEENTSSDALHHLILCSRNLSHHVTEIVNFLALHSSALFRETQVSVEAPAEVPEEPYPEDDGDYDYVVLNSNKPRPPRQPQQDSTPALSSNDVQLLEFYSDHISTIGPLLSQSISTFISSIQQNEPPKVFNGHLKYVILLAYKLLFAGDTVHRNIVNRGIKAEVEAKADDLHKSVLELHDMSKIASKHFPKILPMERIIEHVWQTTAAASQLKKVIFSATCI